MKGNSIKTSSINKNYTLYATYMYLRWRNLKSSFQRTTDARNRILILPKPSIIELLPNRLSNFLKQLT